MHTLVVGSGKGGVGKSTVTVNLGVSLANLGLKVGILDADLYGPSIPIMTGLRELSPNTAIDSAGKERILPFTKYGVQIMSIGFFLEEARPALWRGPALHSILQKLTLDVLWGELDILLIDLPPGTGDVPISLAKLLRINGALIVTTPQEVAMLDALKALNSLHELGIPITGIIENMAGFTPPGSEEPIPIFGKGMGEELARKFSVPLMGSVPILPAIREGGDCGIPSAYHTGDNGVGEHFRRMAEWMLQNR